jgi:1,4-dihydroxy-6-naphthoate synthase
VVVARPELGPEELAGAAFAVPGTMTSAFLALQLFLGQGFNFRIYPYDNVLEAVAAGKADAGLLIHEGQFTFGRTGLQKMVDLGLWWADRTDGLPLPLGGIAVRRDLGGRIHADLTEIIRSSVRYGFEHREEATAHARTFSRDLDDELVLRLLDLYVNELTLDLGVRGKRAIRRFLDEGAEAGLIPRLRDFELIP